MVLPSFPNWNPSNWITYGPNENCNLNLCPVEASIFKYRPSLAANSVFIALFGVSLLIHLYQGFRWRTWAFMTAMFLGCVCEMVGYGGRILMWKNPFSFPGFITQIVCITIGPAFYAAGIYLTLGKIIVHLGTQYSRLPPLAYTYIFVACDVVSLTLQATGGGMSSSSSGNSTSGVNIAIAGLAFQVFTLIVFSSLAIDYAIRYLRHRRAGEVEGWQLTSRFKIFVGFLTFAILLILIRSIYRIDELHSGYRGKLLHNQGLFIGLEGVMIIIAAFALNVAHPGPVFAGHERRAVMTDPEVTAATKGV